MAHRPLIGSSEWSTGRAPAPGMAHCAPAHTGRAADHGKGIPFAHRLLSMASGRASAPRNGWTLTASRGHGQADSTHAPQSVAKGYCSSLQSVEPLPGTLWIPGCRACALRARKCCGRRQNAVGCTLACHKNWLRAKTGARYSSHDGICAVQNRAIVCGDVRVSVGSSPRWETTLHLLAFPEPGLFNRTWGKRT
eukprot:gene8480-biopygen22625